MTMPDPSSETDLFEVLSAISTSGPDAHGLLWVSFKPDDGGIGAIIAPRRFGRRTSRHAMA
jgi:hypothetical protein